MKRLQGSPGDFGMSMAGGSVEGVGSWWESSVSAIGGSAEYGGGGWTSAAVGGGVGIGFLWGRVVSTGGGLTKGHIEKFGGN